MFEPVQRTRLSLSQAQACARAVYSEPGSLDAIAFARRILHTPAAHVDEHLCESERVIQEADLVDLMFLLHKEFGTQRIAAHRVDRIVASKFDK